jgi:hypothetical protein
LFFFLFFRSCQRNRSCLIFVTFQLFTMVLVRCSSPNSQPGRLSLVECTRLFTTPNHSKIYYAFSVSFRYNLFLLQSTNINAFTLLTVRTPEAMSERTHAFTWLGSLSYYGELLSSCFIIKKSIICFSFSVDARYTLRILSC